MNTQTVLDSIAAVLETLDDLQTALEHNDRPTADQELQTARQELIDLREAMNREKKN